MTASALSVRGAYKAFGGLIAVNSVSFEVGQGELIGLIGPNGSGKTTMLNLISGGLTLDQGEILLGDTRISGLSAHRIAQSGVSRTFQLVRVLPAMDAEHNVIAGAVFGHRRLWGASARNLAHDLLALVGLRGQEHLPVSTMTYIDQKRVELARALASDPSILLLDEWLAGLNPSELILGIELIETLSKQGRTIIMVEHVMDAIRSLCGRCVVMNSGRMIKEGAVEAVLSDPEVIEAYLGDDDA